MSRDDDDEFLYGTSQPVQPQASEKNRDIILGESRFTEGFSSRGSEIAHFVPLCLNVMRQIVVPVNGIRCDQSHSGESLLLKKILFLISRERNS
jgi:hypothetical protein